MGLAVSAQYCCTLSRTTSTNQGSYASLMIYRIPDAGIDIQDFCAIITPSGRKLTALSAHIPFPLVRNSTLLDSLSLHPLSSASCYTPVSTRALLPSQPAMCSGSAQHTSYDSFTSLSDFLSNQFGGRYAGYTSFSFVANSPLSLRDPFPQMFTPDITPLGLIHSVSREELAESGASAMVKSIPVGTSIENNSGLSLLSSCANLFEQRTHLHLFSIRQNIEGDLMEESKHSLLSRLDRYPVEMQSPSD